MLHVACFIAKSVRFMTALGVGGIGQPGRSPVVSRRGGLEPGRCPRTTACGHPAAKATRTRVAVSMMRAAILIRRSRRVANSAPGQRLRLGDRVAHHEHQPVGGGVQQQAHLIGQRRAATGPVGGKLALVQLDQVLGLTTRAIEGVVEPFGAAGDVGHHVADVQTLAGCLDARGHAPSHFQDLAP